SRVRYLGDMDLVGSLTMSQGLTNFPDSPRQNTIIVKADGTPWIYSTIGDLPTWRPLLSMNSYYIHTQGVASTTWTISHNLGTCYFVFVCYDDTGNVMQPSRIIPNSNGLSFQATFSVAVTGTLVVFAAAAGLGDGGNDTVFGGIISTDTVALASRYYLVEGGNISLPSSPVVGDRVLFYDAQPSSSFSAITVSPLSSLKINGATDNALLDVPGYQATF